MATLERALLDVDQSEDLENAMQEAAKRAREGLSEECVLAVFALLNYKLLRNERRAAVAEWGDADRRVR